MNCSEVGFCSSSRTGDRMRFEFVISRLESSRPSQPGRRFATGCNLRITGPEIPAFLALELSCGSTYQITVGIECVQKPRFVRAGIRLNSLQCIFINKKRCLYCAIVSPKSHGSTRWVI
jgi:hypothetical protein